MQIWPATIYLQCTIACEKAINRTTIVKRCLFHSKEIETAYR